MRFAHTQVWPVLRYLPPSSIEAFFTVFEHCSRSTLPTWVEPVKVILRTMGLEVISPPIAEELPVSTLSTPLGMPARSPSSAIASAEYGVAVAGFTTMVQPAASAGPALRVIMALGKFHGVIAAHTPIGSLITTMRLSVPCAGMVSP